MRLGFLGPEGTFSQQAAIAVNEDCELVAYSTIADVISAVNSGKVQRGIVPIENSTEGTINVTVDKLTFDCDLFIKKQVELDIKQNLLVKKGTDISKITKILSHPQGLAQCRGFLNSNFPDAKTVQTSSTSEAARLASESDGCIGAIGLKNLAQIYSLDIYRESIQDSDENFTTFALLSKEQSLPCVKGKKTSAAFSTFNEPGQLYKILNIFYIWDFNLTEIISRPMRNKSKEYVFYIELEGRGSDKDLRDALEMVKRKTSFFKFLGSYEVLDLRNR